jgi:hypothetical protein
MMTERRRAHVASPWCVANLEATEGAALLLSAYDDRDRVS